MGYRGEVVYIGASRRNLSRRVTQRFRKVSGRQNITPEEVTIRCLTVHRNWIAYGPEAILQDHYAASWNGSSFGSNDPGRNRERTNKPVDGWDQTFPIRLDWKCGIEPGTYPVITLLRLMKADLPYTLRYSSCGRGWRRGHPDFYGRMAVVPRSGMTPHELLDLVMPQLPGWQATQFPSTTVS